MAALTQGRVILGGIAQRCAGMRTIPEHDALAGDSAPDSATQFHILAVELAAAR